MNKIFSIFIGLLALVVFATTQVEAMESQFSKSISISEEEIVDGDFFASGETVTIKGTINGDAYIAGGQISIEGNINGDLLVAGGMVEISGEISQNARIVGGQVSLNQASIGRNLSVGSGMLRIQDSAQLGGNIVSGSGTIIINSPTSGDVRLAAGNITLNSPVSGNAYLAGGDINLSEAAKIEGDLTYWSENDIKLSSKEMISGKIIKKDISSNYPRPHITVSQEVIQQSIDKFMTGFRVVKFITMLIIGFLFVNFFPSTTKKTEQILQKNPWQALFVGFVGLVVMPLIFSILFATVIAIPLGFVLLGYYLLLLSLSPIVFSFWLGSAVVRSWRRSTSITESFLLGAGLLYIIRGLIGLGSFIGLLATVFGMGALLMSNRDLYLKGRRYKTL